MKKLLFILLIFILMTLGVSSCCCGDTQTSCDNNSDCKDTEYCESNNLCTNNICLDGYHDCGKGKCVPGGVAGYRCVCDENAVFASEHLLCVPTCNGYSEECSKFHININECNMEKGHCDTQCRGEGSCPPGYTCTKKCTKIID